MEITINNGCKRTEDRKKSRTPGAHRKRLRDIRKGRLAAYYGRLKSQQNKQESFSDLTEKINLTDTLSESNDQPKKAGMELFGWVLVGGMILWLVSPDSTNKPAKTLNGSPKDKRKTKSKSAAKNKVKPVPTIQL